MYARQPQTSQWEMWGLGAEDLTPERLEVWPDVVEPFLLFLDMRTQWRVGPRGATGLDYRVLFELFDVRGVARDARAQLFDDIRAMELVALSYLRSA